MPLKSALLAVTAAVALVLPAAAAAHTAPARAGRCPALQAELDAFAREALDGRVPGVAVALGRAGAPPLVRAYGLADVEHGAALTPDSVFRIASITKPFTAAAVLKLAAEGRLSLDDRAADLLPDRPWLGQITVRQLLDQTAGLADYAEDPATVAGKAAPRGLGEMGDRIAALEPRSRFEPGEGWGYSNSNYAVLGLIIERVSGQPWADHLEAAVLAPAEAGGLAVDAPDELVPGRVRGYSLGEESRPRPLRNADWIHPSMPGPAGALRARPADLVRWSEALFAGRILPPETVAQLLEPGRLADGRTTRWGMPEAWREGLQSDYGLGWFLADSPLGPRLWHGGDIEGFTGWLAHWPEHGLTAVVLFNADFRSIDTAAVEAVAVRHLDCLGAA